MYVYVHMYVYAYRWQNFQELMDLEVHLVYIKNIFSICGTKFDLANHLLNKTRLTLSTLMKIDT